MPGSALEAARRAKRATLRASGLSGTAMGPRGGRDDAALHRAPPRHRARRVQPRGSTSPRAGPNEGAVDVAFAGPSSTRLAGNVLPGYEIGGDWFDYVENRDGAWLGVADSMGQ